MLSFQDRALRLLLGFTRAMTGTPCSRDRRGGAGLPGMKGWARGVSLWSASRRGLLVERTWFEWLQPKESPRMNVNRVGILRAGGDEKRRKINESGRE